MRLPCGVSREELIAVLTPGLCPWTLLGDGTPCAPPPKPGYATVRRWRIFSGAAAIARQTKRLNIKHLVGLYIRRPAASGTGRGERARSLLPDTAEPRYATPHESLM